MSGLDLRRYLPEGLAGLLIVALILVSGASAVFTFMGALGAAVAGGGGIAAMAAALLFGLAVWAMLYVLWSMALAIVPKAGRFRPAAFGVVALIIVLVLGMSTWLGAAGLAGAAALQLHMRNAVSAYDEILARSLGAVLKLEALIPVLTASAEGYAANAEAERTRGVYTGVPGPGAVERALVEIGADLEGVASGIRNLSTSAPGTAAQAAERLAAMREVIDADGNIADRERAFAAHANALRQELAKLDASGTIAVARRVLKSLENVADKQAVSTRSAKLAKAQKTALDALARDLKSTSAKIGGVLDDVEDGGPVPMPPTERLTAPQAIFTYRLEFAPYWAASAGLDLTSLVILLFLTIAERQKAKPDGDDPDPGRILVSDLVLAGKAMQLVQEEGLALPAPTSSPAPKAEPPCRRGRPPKKKPEDDTA